MHRTLNSLCAEHWLGKGTQHQRWRAAGEGRALDRTFKWQLMFASHATWHALPGIPVKS